MSAYEVQVCRVQVQGTPDDCGSCLLCFETTVAQGKCEWALVLQFGLRDNQASMSKPNTNSMIRKVP